MLFELVVAGFGGQGILFTGDLIAEAALKEGKNVTFLPTYGVAMRGGTANCVVTLSDEDIGSPILDQPDAAIIMNEASMVKFQPMIREGGLIVANVSLVDQAVFNRHGEIRIVWVHATEIARDRLGAERSANMLALGAFLATEPIVSPATIVTVLKGIPGAHKQALAKKNIAALQAGLEAAAAQGGRTGWGIDNTGER